MNAKQLIEAAVKNSVVVSVPGAGHYVINRDRDEQQLSSKRFKSAGAAGRARKRGTKMHGRRTVP